MVEKSDEFDKWMLNRQNIPYQNFALKKFSILHTVFYNYALLTWLCQGFSHYVETYNFEILLP